MCGNKNKCTQCSFEECKRHAQNSNAVAFAYRSTSRKFCRLCDQRQLDNSKPYADFGVYKVSMDNGPASGNNGKASMDNGSIHFQF